MKQSFLYLLILPTILFYSNTLSAQWIRQYPLAKLEQVVDIAYHADGYGFAVGADDMILRLDPATTTWDLLTTWDAGWDLRAVDYLEGTNGSVVAAGGDGLILSTNAGETWVEIPNGPVGILAIHVIHSADILVISTEGVFRWTSNAWDDLFLPVTTGVDGGFILDAQHIWCFTNGASPEIFSTANGGNNWNTTTDVERPDVVKFFNDTYGIAFDGRTVYNSVDGGLQWTEVSNNIIHTSVSDFTFGASPNVMMAATFNGEPTISLDSGETWTKKELGLINQRNFSAAAVSDTEFWVGNDLSSIAMSSDAGETWLETSGPDRKIMNDVFFLNRNFGFAAATEGKLLRTTNGGSIWEDISFGETRSLLSLHGLTENDLWLGGNQTIYHSADMGETWQQKANLFGANMIDIHAVSATIVLACSTSGIIYRSDDAGTTWDTVYQTNNQIRSIAKVEGNRYIATGFNGLILRSENQGLTWAPLVAPEAGLQYEQTQFIGQEGWMITSSFKKTMWHTTNAGDSWNPITLPIDRFWDGVYFITPDTGIIVGRSTTEGRAYLTFNGGANWQPGYITDFPLFGVTGLPNPNGSAWIYGFGSDIEILPYCNMFPVISNFTGNNTPCENDTVTYSVTAQDVDLFFWLFPSTWQIIGNPNNDTIQVRVGRISGAISVTGSNTCGFSSPLSVSAAPVLLPKINNLLGDRTPCIGDFVNYDAVQTDGTSFIWNFPGDWTIQGPSNNATIVVQAGELEGPLSVIGFNQCGETPPFSINVTTEMLPTMNVVTGPLNICVGDTVEFVGQGAFFDNVIWTYPADWTVLGQDNEIAIVLIAGETGGSVTAASINDCGTSPVIEFEVSPFQAPEVGILNNGSQLYPTSVGMSYQWYLDGNPIVGAISDSLLPLVSGTYTVLVIFSNGCSALSLPVNVIISGIFNPHAYSTLEVYPVPVQEELNIKGIAGGYEYAIFDMTGTLLTKSTSSVSTIDVSAFLNGAYLLKLKQASNVYVAKFVIMR